MKKSIVISIPEPCHEDWAKMTATEKGKFCAVCTKEVIDFTSKSDEELVKILSANKNTCGRVKKSQLNREVKMERKSGQSLAPLAASMLLPLTLFSNNPTTENNSSVEKPMISLGIGRFSNPLDRIQIVTEGIVRDENGNPIKNVTITSSETQTKAWTNGKGEYTIITLDHERLLFSKDNFDAQEIRLSNTSEKINVLLQSDFATRTVSIVVGKIAANPEEKIEEKAAITHTKGTVTDDTGLPLPGANIIIRGTSVGTQTDFDGNYEIETKPGDVLTFSYVGFETKEVTVSNTSNKLDVVLNAGDFLSGEVVITGGISWENPSDYVPPKDPDWYEKAKQAYKNTLAFAKIKKERKKAERKAKRENK